ncbi:ABC transporter substrate-binding protein [Aggregatimonas sangjinii]|uniref:ABC transporter substrate-binding protein n=1 Tax=Aggregatimonas sangjinii TaxID=2583587 RepID=A0A5B7SQ72_9FLAO|nr:ABC transporter substrate-binding protein [Aggregatimonas sangjinii]QCX00342.1 ABC transporter substrate-binding protein [Aggregatimonas sangjinii]
MNKIFLLPLLLLIVCCKEEKKNNLPTAEVTKNPVVNHATGFQIEKSGKDITLIKITSPWPDSEAAFTYALIPKEKMAFMTLNRDAYDAIIAVPVDRIVVTSTTHIPALESLGVEDKLVGFPQTAFISSPKTRKRIAAGLIQELGNNETLNTEMVLALNPEVVVGFGINDQNKAYETLERANIPVVYNGEWTEETPLGKAEWIKFFAPFFGLEKKADSLFQTIEKSYVGAKQLAEKATSRPTVLSGGLYKDVWHVAGGKSWVAQFLADAHTHYIYSDTENTGSISLSLESVLDKAHDADYWINPSLHVSYEELLTDNSHYKQFDAFKNRQVYTNANTQGETGGLLFYELAPTRPDLVLKDLIHIFHPELLPQYQPHFFKPLQ